jgi:hypothetical protein
MIKGLVKVKNYLGGLGFDLANPEVISDLKVIKKGGLDLNVGFENMFAFVCTTTSLQYIDASHYKTHAVMM